MEQCQSSHPEIGQKPYGPPPKQTTGIWLSICEPTGSAREEAGACGEAGAVPASGPEGTSGGVATETGGWAGTTVEVGAGAGGGGGTTVEVGADGVEADTVDTAGRDAAAKATARTNRRAEEKNRM